MGTKRDQEPRWLKQARAEGRVKDGVGVNLEGVAAAATLTNGAEIVKASPYMSEETFQTLVVALALANGWEVYHTRDSRGSEDGFPDLTMVRGTVLSFAELKDHKGEATGRQLTWLEKLAKAGAEVFLWRPSHWRTLEEFLTGDVR